ncbi:MAG: hypothetical protein AB6733_00940 [Clostridiaceae bacterium]
MLIFDDSIFSRNRNKAVELLARVHDHTRNIYLKGFRMLTLGWSDGNTFMPRVYYTYENKKLNLSDLYKKVKKKRGKAKILAAIIVRIGVDSNGNEVKGKIIFVRERNRSRKWLALISTNIELCDDEIIRIYGKRWDIEIF